MEARAPSYTCILIYLGVVCVSVPYCSLGWSQLLTKNHWKCAAEVARASCSGEVMAKMAMPQGRDSRFHGNDQCFEGDST